MNVLVTGGCGFIGSNLVRHLRAERPDWTVVNLDLLTYAGQPREPPTTSRVTRVTSSSGATSGTASWSNTCWTSTGSTPSSTSPPRATSTAPSSGPELFVRTNVLGTQVLLEACHRTEGLARFVMVSTDEVYGSLGPTGAFTETSPLQPSSPYSASKAAADLLALAFHHTFGLDVVVTRCSNNYGPYQFPEKLIPLMVVNALHDEPLPVYGDGGNVRDWLHVEDHCRAAGGGARAGPGGGGLQHRRWRRAAERRPGEDAPRRARKARDPHPLRQGPARARSALRHRPDQDPHRARLDARPHLPAGARGHGPLVRRPPRAGGST